MRIRKRKPMKASPQARKNLPGATGKVAPHRRAKKPGSSGMRQATWESMSKGQRMKEFGTTSYKKYKEGVMSARGKRQRGGGGGSDQGAGIGADATGLGTP